MKKLKFDVSCFALAATAALTLFSISARAQSATATISGVAVAGGYDYTITLHNTGTYSLQSFWYGWTLGGNNLPSNPSSAGNSLGWANSLSGNSIMWGTSSDTPLASGQSGSFTFFSSDTPAAISTPPSGGSVAYVHGIDFSQGLAGDSTGVFYTTLVAAPEPSSIALSAAGSLGLMVAYRRKFRWQP